MTETDIITAVREQVTAQGEATSEAYGLVEEGLVQFPKSAALWILRGDLIQLGRDDISYTLDDALSSYQTALEHEPGSAEAYESIGHFLDAVRDNPAEAESYFRKAVALGGGQRAEEALAQVLEQLANGSPGQDAG